jgi:hypothetical protein
MPYYFFFGSTMGLSSKRAISYPVLSLTVSTVDSIPLIRHYIHEGPRFVVLLVRYG